MVAELCSVGVKLAPSNGVSLRQAKSLPNTSLCLKYSLKSLSSTFRHGINDVSDGWERFANALSPTPPFPKDIYRLRLAGLVVPLLATSIFITSYMFMKGLTFGVGFAFFGDPIIQPGLELLNTKFPNWQKLLEVRNTILKGVPTNAQLTLTLLRVGEANKSPLPPPPTSGETPPEQPARVSTEELGENLNVDHEDLQAAIEADPDVKHEVDGEDVAAAKGKSHGKKASRLLTAAKKTIKGKRPVGIVRCAICGRTPIMAATRSGGWRLSPIALTGDLDCVTHVFANVIPNGF